MGCGCVAKFSTPKQTGEGRTGTRVIAGGDAEDILPTIDFTAGPGAGRTMARVNAQIFARYSLLAILARAWPRDVG
jgi:hypothetical protein